MKNSILIVIFLISFASNAQFGRFLNKAKDAATSKAKEKLSEKTDKATAKTASGESPITGISKSAASTNTKAMVGKWKVEGVICNTNIPELRDQLVAQEQGYNDEYKGFDWIFKNDGSIDITSKSGRGKGEYELADDKITMMINNTPMQCTLQFEEGQMILTQITAVNTLIYVFVKL